MGEFYLEVTAVAEDEDGFAMIRIDQDSRITHIRFGSPDADLLAFDLECDQQDRHLEACLADIVEYAQGNIPTGFVTTLSRSSRGISVVHVYDPRVRIEEDPDPGDYTVHYMVHIGDQAALATLGDLRAALKALHYDRYPHEKDAAQN